MIGRLLAAEAVYDSLLLPYRERADRIMVGMNVFLLLVCLALSPLRDSYASIVLVGVPTLLLSLWLERTHAGALATRLFMASGFMVYTGLIIHQTGGDIEGHFSAFGLIGILLYYRDWRTIVTATLVIYLHHLVLGYAQTLGVPVYVFDSQAFWLLFGVHVAYFLPFIAMMVYLSVWLRREGYEAQNVIVLAQRIVQGNLIEADVIPAAARDMPLIAAVLSMKNRLLDLLRVMPVAAAVIRIDTQTIVSVNEAWVRIIGTLEESSRQIDDSPIWTDRRSWQSLMQRLHELSENLLNKVEVTLNGRDGNPILCELSLILHHDVKPVMAILTIEDITQRRKVEQTMRRLAYRDLLTELPNRTSLVAGLDAALSAWRDDAVPFAVIMLDLDGFKPVNDRYGHEAGDEVLRVIGGRIAHINRADDVAARLGGDEFAVVLNGCGTAMVAEDVARRFIATISQPIHLEKAGVTVNVGASAGYALAGPAESLDADAILKRADAALYDAKRNGKGQVAPAAPA